MVSASLCCLLPSAVLAELPEGGVRLDAPSQDAAVQVQQKQWLDILSEEERSSEKNENVGEPTVVGDDFLAANPCILEDALIQALNGNSADLVSSLAALYRKQPNHNPKLIARADALLAKLKGQTSEAVERYRTLYESDVSDDRILLDLAAAEFQDYRLGEAAAHFRHAAQRDIPAPFWKTSNVFKKLSSGRQNGNGLVESVPYIAITPTTLLRVIASKQGGKPHAALLCLSVPTA